MTRVKRGTTANKSRKNVLRQAKGFRFSRSKKERAANDALMHAGAYAFAHRRDKKSDMRKLWQTRINAALKPLEISYSKFMGAMKKKGIEVDRKILSELAQKEPKVFEHIVSAVK